MSNNKNEIKCGKAILTNQKYRASFILGKKRSKWNGRKRKEENGRKEEKSEYKISKLCKRREKIRRETTKCWEKFEKKELMKKNMAGRKKCTSGQCPMAKRGESSKWTRK